MALDIKCLEEAVRSKISTKRFAHTKRVLETALILADRHKVDLDKARIAALLHDYAKDVEAEKLIRIIEDSGHTLSSLELVQPELLHGPVGAIMAREDFSIEDKDILESIRYHTTGNINLSKLAKIIYLADGIEPFRKYPGIEEIKKAAKEDLDEALLLSLNLSLGFLISKGRLVHPLSIETRNDLIIKNMRSEAIE